MPLIDFANPTRFLRFTERLQPWLIGLTCVLFAAGLITGEAMIGILMAIPIYLTKNPDVFALGFEVPSVVALLIVAAVAALLYRVAVGGSRA